MSHWCQNIQRDEAVRAAEDNRSGPLPTLEEAIERQKHAAMTAGVKEGFVKADGEWKRLTDDELRQLLMIPKSVSASSAVEPENKGDSMATNGLRTERVTLEITMPDGGRKYHGNASSWDWRKILLSAQNFFGPGESVRVVDESAPAASVAAGTKPVAWAILRGGHFIVATVNEIAANESCKGYGGTVVPLYAAPQPASGWLTQDEIAVCVGLRDYCRGTWETWGRKDTLWLNRATTLDALLARSSPPEVVLPFGGFVVCEGETPIDVRDRQWRKSLAAAGVTVKEVGE